VALNGHRRVLVVLLAAASVVGLAGTAAASLPGGGAAARPDSGIDTAAGTTIKILAKKRLLQNQGQTGTLMAVDGVNFRAGCSNAAGFIGISVDAKASVPAFLVRAAGSGTSLTTSFQQLLFSSSNARSGFEQTFDVLLPHGVTRRFDLIYGLLLSGSDCMTQLTEFNG
jgi:hypothetical protein